MVRACCGHFSLQKVSETLVLLAVCFRLTSLAPKLLYASSSQRSSVPCAVALRNLGPVCGPKKGATAATCYPCCQPELSRESESESREQKVRVPAVRNTKASKQSIPRPLFYASIY